MTKNTSPASAIDTAEQRLRDAGLVVVPVDRCPIPTCDACNAGPVRAAA